MESDCTKDRSGYACIHGHRILNSKNELGLLCLWSNRRNVQRMDKNNYTHSGPHCTHEQTTAKNISSQAFCRLADIPDFGLRMQTLRITEFFLLINSNNCQSGKTALARLCALCHKTPHQMKE